jgi:hypothetical protein
VNGEEKTFYETDTYSNRNSFIATDFVTAKHTKATYLNERIYVCMDRERKGRIGTVKE